MGWMDLEDKKEFTKVQRQEEHSLIRQISTEQLCVPGTLLAIRDAAVNRIQGPCPQGTHNAVRETFNNQERK